MMYRAIPLLLLCAIYSPPKGQSDRALPEPGVAPSLPQGGTVVQPAEVEKQHSVTYETAESLKDRGFPQGDTVSPTEAPSSPRRDVVVSLGEQGAGCYETAESLKGRSVHELYDLLNQRAKVMNDEFLGYTRLKTQLENAKVIGNDEQIRIKQERVDKKERRLHALAWEYALILQARQEYGNPGLPVELRPELDAMVKDRAAQRKAEAAGHTTPALTMNPGDTDDGAARLDEITEAAGHTTPALTMNPGDTDDDAARLDEIIRRWAEDMGGYCQHNITRYADAQGGEVPSEIEEMLSMVDALHTLAAQLKLSKENPSASVSKLDLMQVGVAGVEAIEHLLAAHKLISTRAKQSIEEKLLFISESLGDNTPFDHIVFEMLCSTGALAQIKQGLDAALGSKKTSNNRDVADHLKKVIELINGHSAAIESYFVSINTYEMVMQLVGCLKAAFGDIARIILKLEYMHDCNEEGFFAFVKEAWESVDFLYNIPDMLNKRDLSATKNKFEEAAGMLYESYCVENMMQFTVVITEVIGQCDSHFAALIKEAKSCATSSSASSASSSSSSAVGRGMGVTPIARSGPAPAGSGARADTQASSVIADCLDRVNEALYNSGALTDTQASSVIADCLDRVNEALYNSGALSKAAKSCATSSSSSSAVGRGMGVTPIARSGPAPAGSGARADTQASSVIADCLDIVNEALYNLGDQHNCYRNTLQNLTEILIYSAQLLKSDNSRNNRRHTKELRNGWDVIQVVIDEVYPRISGNQGVREMLPDAITNIGKLQEELREITTQELLKLSDSGREFISGALQKGRDYTRTATIAGLVKKFSKFDLNEVAGLLRNISHRRALKPDPIAVGNARHAVETLMDLVAVLDPYFRDDPRWLLHNVSLALVNYRAALNNTCTIVGEMPDLNKMWTDLHEYSTFITERAAKTFGRQLCSELQKVQKMCDAGDVSSSIQECIRTLTQDLKAQAKISDKEELPTSILEKYLKLNSIDPASYALSVLSAVQTLDINPAISTLISNLKIKNAVQLISTELDKNKMTDARQ